MDLQKLNYVIEIHEARSFSKAAKKLGLSQPYLSRCIQQIEKDNDFQIFDRSTNPIRLTDQGKLFIETAYAILERWNYFIQQLKDGKDLKSGRVTLGLPSYRNAYSMPNVLVKFKKLYPNIDLKLIEGPLLSLEQTARSGQIDLFFAPLPINEQLYDFVPVYTEQVMLCMPPEHPLVSEFSKKSSLTLEDIALLKDDNFITMNPQMRIAKLAHTICDHAGFSPHIILESNSVESIFALTLAGLGCAFLPDSVVKCPTFSASPTAFSLAMPETWRNVVLAYRKGCYLSQAAKELIEIIRSELS